MKCNTNKYYIFYDGDCGFCNHWVQWILKSDKKEFFLFSSLQSEFGQNFLKHEKINVSDFTTIYLWKPNEYYLDKSQAIIKIVQCLGGVKGTLAYVIKIFPKSLLDILYNKISNNRFRISSNFCVLPSISERERFIL